jgi:hypothetical protein
MKAFRFHVVVTLFVLLLFGVVVLCASSWAQPQQVVPVSEVTVEQGPESDAVALLLNVIKIVSMLTAGALGLIGTFKDFSDKSKAVKWRKWTIFGIVFATILSVVIQNVEYLKERRAATAARIQANDTAKILRGITTKASNISEAQVGLSETAKTIQGDQGKLSATTQTIQQGQTTTLATTQQIRSLQSVSLAEQGRLLGGQNAAIVSLNRMLNSDQPVGFRVTLNYKISENPCLSKYVESVRVFASRYLSAAPFDVVRPPNTGLEIGFASNKIQRVDVAEDSPVSPNLENAGADATTILKHLYTTLSFAPPGSNESESADYIINLDDRRGARSSAIVANFLPTFGMSIMIRIDYDQGILYFEISAFGVVKNNTEHLQHSITQLTNSKLTLSFGQTPVSPRWPSQCFRPTLGEVEMLWGPNYMHESDFDLSKAPSTTWTGGITFSHTCNRKEFGL